MHSPGAKRCYPPRACSCHTPRDAFRAGALPSKRCATACWDHAVWLCRAKLRSPLRARRLSTGAEDHRGLDGNPSVATIAASPFSLIRHISPPAAQSHRIPRRLTVPDRRFGTAHVSQRAPCVGRRRDDSHGWVHSLDRTLSRQVLQIDVTPGTASGTPMGSRTASPCVDARSHIS